MIKALTWACFFVSGFGAQYCAFQGDWSNAAACGVGLATNGVLVIVYALEKK